jgi:hypothetical protein
LRVECREKRRKNLPSEGFIGGTRWRLSATPRRTPHAALQHVRATFAPMRTASFYFSTFLFSHRTAAGEASA